jgi:translation elongation factor EF-Ts
LETSSPEDTGTVSVAPIKVVNVHVPASLPRAEASRALRRKWTEKEDAILIEATKIHGGDWMALARMVPGRSNHQYRQRWLARVHMAPSMDSKGRWTEEEDMDISGPQLL